jgi:NADPH2:quinone reductase
MTNAIVLHEVGGPEQLRFEAVPDPVPRPGQARIRQSAIGLNFIDVYLRTGLYKAPAFPFIPGQEGAGVVEALGPGVSGLAVGDRVAYAGVNGAYAEIRVLPAERLVHLPDGVDDRTAAAMMLKGMTAEYLLFRCARVEAGNTILFHAAAGGVGSIACQWARALGLRVIGTAGGPDKVRRARDNGCDVVIDTQSEDIVARVKSLTGGAGVSVVFDSVGKDTFAASLDSLRPRGLLVLFGQSSGVVPPLELSQLAAKGSLFLTRPSLAHYVASRSDLELSAGRLCAAVSSGAVRIQIGRSYPLRDAAQAHRDLEARKTTGSTLLLP